LDSYWPASPLHLSTPTRPGNANGTQDRMVDCTNVIVVDDPAVGPITVILVAQFILAP
jgi:hypothetical protein